MSRIIFVTATDTGAGKTVLTSLLARSLRDRGLRVAALKPICSGGRDDARILHTALGGELPLDQINPWHFRSPIAPALAAAREKKQLWLAEVLDHIRRLRKHFDVTLVEGAGGILSPLGEDFDSRDLICALRATPLVVAPNQLGVVNQVRLTLEALPPGRRANAVVILRMLPTADSSTGSNRRLLERLLVPHLCQLPWLGANFDPAAVLRTPGVRRALAALTDGIQKGAPLSGEACR